VAEKDFIDRILDGSTPPAFKLAMERERQVSAAREQHAADDGPEAVAEATEPLVPGLDDVQVLEDIDMLGSLEHTMKRLRAQLERLQAAGGTDALVGYRNALLGQLVSVYNALREPTAPHAERLKAIAAAQRIATARATGR
jgi:hypothetical protein